MGWPSDCPATTTHGPGGTVAYVVQAFPQLSETFVETEIRALRRLGVEVVVLSVYRPPAGLEGPTDLPPERILYPPRAAAVLGAYLRWGLRRPGPAVRSLVRALGTRSLTMVRGVWLAGWAATVIERSGAWHVHAHFATDSSCVADSAAALLGRRFTFTVHAHEIYLRNNGLCGRAHRAHRLVTVCRYNLDQLRALCPGLDEDRVRIIYCGVDPDAFRIEEPAVDTAALPAAGARLVSVGRLVDTKGFDVLIGAVQLLRDGGLALACDVVGAGPLEGPLQAQIDAAALQDVVHLAGPMQPPDVARLLGQADLFVLPCRVASSGNRDSMPVAIKEAMAAELPVVSTEVVGIPEMIDEKVGRLVPPDDPSALAEAIREVLALPKEDRRSMGRAGRERVSEQFNVWRETERLLGVFREQ